MDTVGSRIKWLRTSNNLNQKEFCDNINLAQSRLSEIESNKTKPSFDTLLAIKETYSVSLDWIASGNGYCPTDTSNPVNGYLSKKELDLIEKYRSGLHPIFDSDIKRLTGEIGHLSDREHDLILKYRRLSEDDKQDVYEIINLKYERGLKIKKEKSLTSKNGRADTNETA